eukprot:scaffold2435_cov92-Skeletonema_dohrnii-CCMP3373.AAC.4
MPRLYNTPIIKESESDGVIIVMGGMIIYSPPPSRSSHHEKGGGWRVLGGKGTDHGGKVL